jgi:hypothetical protein
MERNKVIVALMQPTNLYKPVAGRVLIEQAEAASLPSK